MKQNSFLFYCPTPDEVSVNIDKYCKKHNKKLIDLIILTTHYKDKVCKAIEEI